MLRWLVSKLTPVADKKDAPIEDSSQPKTKKVRSPNLETLPKICLTPGPLGNIADYSFSDAESIAALTQTSLAFYHAVQPVILGKYQPFYKLAQRAIKRESTLENKSAVLAMLHAAPWLLHTKIRRSRDESKRVFENRTLFQLVRGAGDDDFACALKPIFIKLYRGNAAAAINEMKRQRREMIESEEKEREKEATCKARLAEILKPVIAAINAEQFNHGSQSCAIHAKSRQILDPNITPEAFAAIQRSSVVHCKSRLILSPETLTAIAKFRKEYAEIRLIMIEGMHFRYRTLTETLAVFLQALTDWDWKRNRYSLFQDAVLATIEADFPMNDAQRSSQGLYFLQTDKKPESYQRSLALRKHGADFYDTVRGPSMNFVLDGCYVDIDTGEPNGPTGVISLMRDYETLTSNKESNLQSLCSHPVEAKADVPIYSSLKK